MHPTNEKLAYMTPALRLRSAVHEDVSGHISFLIAKATLPGTIILMSTVTWKDVPSGDTHHRHRFWQLAVTYTRGDGGEKMEVFYLAGDYLAIFGRASVVKYDGDTVFIVFDEPRKAIGRQVSFRTRKHGKVYEIWMCEHEFDGVFELDSEYVLG